MLGNDVDPDASGTIIVNVGSVMRTGGTLTGTLNVNANGTFTYTPPTGTGTETFSYTIDDNNGSGLDSLVPAVITLTVQSMPNQAPTAGDDPYALTGNVSLTVTDASGQGLLANDTDPDVGSPVPGTDLFVDVPSVTRTGGTVTGSFNVNTDGTFTYTPRWA